MFWSGIDNYLGLIDKCAVTQFGIELTAQVQEAIFAGRLSAISHLQVSVPNSFSFPEALRIASSLELPIGLHSTVHDFFEASQLAANLESAFRKRVSNMRPLYLVEHFTSYCRDSADRKSAFWSKELTFDQGKVSKLQRSISCPLYLENIPITTDVEAYFEEFYGVTSGLSGGAAVDLAHLWISAAALFSGDHRRAESWAKDIVQRLKPEIVHIGGVSLRGGVLGDNHHRVSPELFSLLEAKEFLKYVVFEPDPRATLGRIVEDTDRVVDSFASSCTNVLPISDRIENFVTVNDRVKRDARAALFKEVASDGLGAQTFEAHSLESKESPLSAFE
jgi:hypothetical protein